MDPKIKAFSLRRLPNVLKRKLHKEHFRSEATSLGYNTLNQILEMSLVVAGDMKTRVTPTCPRPRLSSRLKRWHSQRFSSVQLSSVTQSCPTLCAPWIAARQASLSITNSRSSLTLTSIESVMPSSHLILCCPLLLLPPILPSIRVFSNESTLCMRWPKYWSFSFSISPSKEHPGLISFRMDWLDLFAVQGTLKSLLQ